MIAFDFLQFASVKCLKIFTDCEVCRTDHLKSEKNRGYSGIFLLFAVLCFPCRSQIWSREFLFNQQALGRAQIYLTVQQILGSSTEGNALRVCSFVFCNGVRKSGLSSTKTKFE